MGAPSAGFRLAVPVRTPIVRAHLGVVRATEGECSAAIEKRPRNNRRARRADASPEERRSSRDASFSKRRGIRSQIGFRDLDSDHFLGEVQ